MRHVLKTWPQYYEDVESGNKTFEVRKHDRDFKVGDTLLLQEFDPSKKASQQYSGKELEFTITYVLLGGNFGIQEGYVVMGIKPKEY